MTCAPGWTSGGVLMVQWWLQRAGRAGQLTDAVSKV